MAEGGAGYNAAESILKANPALEIQSFSGGGMTFDMDGGGTRGMIDGFEAKDITDDTLKNKVSDIN